MKKAVGWLLLLTSAASIWIFYADMERQELFEKNGKEVQATVTDLQPIMAASVSKSGNGKWVIGLAAVDYEYTVMGSAYSGHVKWNAAWKSKPKIGDKVAIKYLEDNPKVSIYIEDIVNPIGIENLIGVFFILGIIGVVQIIRPNKSGNISDTIDWAEKERHESGD